MQTSHLFVNRHSLWIWGRQHKIVTGSCLSLSTSSNHSESGRADCHILFTLYAAYFKWDRPGLQAGQPSTHTLINGRASKVNLKTKQNQKLQFLLIIPRVRLQPCSRPMMDCARTERPLHFLISWWSTQMTACRWLHLVTGTRSSQMQRRYIISLFCGFESIFFIS